MSQNGNLISGRVKRHPDGFGYFIPDSPDLQDVYIPEVHMNGAMTNDRVLVEVQHRKKFRKPSGSIIEITQRNLKSAFGKIHILNDGSGLILDSDSHWGDDLRISVQNLSGAKEGSFVGIEILTYPEENSVLSGKVVEVCDGFEDAQLDLKRVLYSSDIPQKFNPKTIAEAKKIPDHVEFDKKSKRVDLTKTPLVTIDGATAKDFDDAVFVEETKIGFRALVSIADVGEYVKKDSYLDQEAFERGNSTYFPGAVVPMLPENLSNGVCSLNPSVYRKTLTCEMNFDRNGEIQKYQFYESIIFSHARLTYGEVQEAIDGEEIEMDSVVKKSVLAARDLAEILINYRIKSGSLDLDIPETQVLIDDMGHPEDIIQSHRLFAHRLIEELMLSANICAAHFFVSQKIPTVFRIHEPPPEDSLENLNSLLKSFGIHKRVEGTRLQKKIHKILEKFEGTPKETVIQLLVLRSMSQAKYSFENKGHFGLGFEMYTHFTSPIRRYSDLIVHRLIKSKLKDPKSKHIYSEEELESAGTLLSACEQRSIKAERRFISIKKARFMKRFLGHRFKGQISSVAKFGAFVLLREYDVDGLVKTDELSREPMFFDESNLELVGKRSGFKFRIGDQIEIVVANVDVEKGQIDFSPTVKMGDDRRSRNSSKYFKGPKRKGEKSRKKKSKNLS